MSMTKVKLIRTWSGYEAGETVEVEEITAVSMIRKGYGHEVRPAPVIAKGPRVETADAPCAAERAVVTPAIESKEPPPLPQADATEEPKKKTGKNPAKKGGV